MNNSVIVFASDFLRECVLAVQVMITVRKLAKFLSLKSLQTCSGL